MHTSPITSPNTSLLALLVALLPLQALACSCAPAPPPQQALAEASEVFRGTVLAAEPPDPSAFRVLGIDFQVSEVWKGEPLPLLRVHTPSNSAACGRSLQVGIEYLVYTDESGWVTLCSRTKPSASAQADLAALGAGVAPEQADRATLARHAVVAGAWHRPEAPGEGVLIELIDGERAALYWYGHEPAPGEQAAPGQRWLFGVGRFDGNLLEVEQLLQPRGEGFAADYDPDSGTLPEVGRVWMRFIGNGRATLRYSLHGFSAFPADGELVLQRINRPPVAEPVRR